MKAVILAGGMGTRLSEETDKKPKPMVEIGDKPILWHIMKNYSVHGIHDFIICLGYKGHMIKEYFANYNLHSSDITVDVGRREVTFHENNSDPWRVSLIDTGELTGTGGRLKRALPYLRDEEAFCFTYGDGVADVDVSATLAFHRAHGGLATVTAVPPPSRFGIIRLEEDQCVAGFVEKPRSNHELINGGFFVLSPQVGDYIDGDPTMWEREPMQRLSRDRRIYAYIHNGFWQCMDTLRDRRTLEDLWNAGTAPWRTWA